MGKSWTKFEIKQFFKIVLIIDNKSTKYAILDRKYQYKLVRYQISFENT